MSRKTKILVFIDWFLPAYKAGGPIRSVANLIEYTHELFDFHIITSNKDYMESEAMKNIRSNEQHTYEKKADIIYLSDEYMNAASIKKIINEAEFDTAYINGIYSYYFSILPLRFLRKSGKKIIIAPRGMLSGQAFSSKSLKKKLFLIAAKAFGLYKKVSFQATDKEEVSDIQNRISRNAKITYLPNFPKLPNSNNFKKINKTSGKLKLVSIARISSEKNTLFALQILGKFKYDGIIEFDLYGSVYNKSYWEKCLRIIELLPLNIHVKYKKSVKSSDVDQTYSLYHFSFMPSKGENFGHSIFESFASGRPAIISDKTPWKKLNEKNIGWDVSLKDTEQYAEIIQKCIDMSQEKYDEMSIKAFNFALQYAQNDSLIEQTKKLFTL